MASHRIPIINSASVPNAAALGSVRVGHYSEFATNDLWKRLIVVFENTLTRIGLPGGFQVPLDYFGSPVIIVVWTAIVTTGNVLWEFDYRAVGGDDAESLDQATVQQSVNLLDAAPTAVNNRLECQLAFTGSNLSPGDVVEYEIFRGGNNLSDTMIAPALMFDLLFQYSDV